MGQRASIFLIWKKDLGKKIRRKRCGKIVEYWSYKGKEGNLVMPNGQKYVNEDELHLDAIIACEENHIVKDRKDNFLVNGVKFYGDDLSKYIEYRDKLK